MLVMPGLSAGPVLKVVEDLIDRKRQDLLELHDSNRNGSIGRATRKLCETRWGLGHEA